MSPAHRKRLVHPRRQHQAAENPATARRPSTRSSPVPARYDPRDIYAHQARVNELYLSYSKGPFFLRFGRQSISWGESDTIALLDQSNPFDITAGGAGLLRGPRRGAHPALHAAHQLQSVRRPRTVVERLRRRLLGAGLHRQHHRRRAADHRRQPVLAARHRPADAGRPAGRRLPADVPVPLLRSHAAAGHLQQPLGRPLPERRQPLPDAADLGLSHLSAGPDAGEDRLPGQPEHRRCRINGTNFFLVVLEHKPVHGLRPRGHVLLRVARRHRPPQRAVLRARSRLHSAGEPQHLPGRPAASGAVRAISEAPEPAPQCDQQPRQHPLRRRPALRDRLRPLLLRPLPQPDQQLRAQHLDRRLVERLGGQQRPGEALPLPGPAQAGPGVLPG